MQIKEQIKQAKKKQNTKTSLPRFYLIERRTELGYSVEMASRECKISPYYYFQLENGIRGKNLTVRLLLRLIKALEMEPLDFLTSEADYIDYLNEINK